MSLTLAALSFDADLDVGSSRGCDAAADRRLLSFALLLWTY